MLIEKISDDIGGPFANTLLQDIQNYGTLSDRTLRKIIEAAGKNREFEKAVRTLEKEMGSDYLEKVKVKLPANEIVVAIEHK